MTNPCNNCGETTFEEIAGFFHCTYCGLQRVGYRVEISHHVTEGTTGASLVEVRKQRKRKVQDTGVPWTTPEAFNRILAHQCQQLMLKLKLGPEFRDALFYLWALYLSKCEGAFCDHEEPKLNAASGARDIQLIKQGLKKVTKAQNKGYAALSRARVGNVVLEREALCNPERVDGDESPGGDGLGQILDGILNQSSDSDNENQAISDPKTAEEEELELKSLIPQLWEPWPITPEQEHQFRNPLPFNYPLDSPRSSSPDSFASYDFYEDPAPLPIDFAVNSRKCPSPDSFGPYDPFQDPDLYNQAESNLSRRTGSCPISRPKLSRVHIKSRHCLSQKIRKALKKFDTSSESESDTEGVWSFNNDEAGIDFINEDGAPGPGSSRHLTKRSRLIQYMLKDAEDLKKILMHTNQITIEKMTTHKTLSFILLAFRILGLNFHADDIFHWAHLGHIPFYDATSCLPKEWLFSAADRNRLKPKKTISIRNLESNTAQLKAFLDLPTIDPPKFEEMVKRQLIDLNLPVQLASIIHEKINLKKINFFRKKIVDLKDSKSMASHEVFSFCSIVAILIILFGLDGKIEEKQSKRVRQEYPDAFIWTDWYKHMQMTYFSVRSHWFPHAEKSNSRLIDGEVVSMHHQEISHKWRGTESTMANYIYSARTEDYHKTLSENLEILHIGERVDLDPPLCSLYHFSQAKEFVGRRLEDLNILPDNWTQDFTGKSISYLFQPAYRPRKLLKLPYPAAPITKRSWGDIVHLWPRPVRFFLRFGFYSLQRSRGKLAQVIYKILWSLKAKEKSQKRKIQRQNRI